MASDLAPTVWCRAMLTVAKIGGGDTARQLYYEQEVALSHPAYYAGQDGPADDLDAAALTEPPGVWLGAGADALGLREVRVEIDGLRAMWAGRNPDQGVGLAEHACSVSAFDLLFAAPKSVSVAHAVADGRRGRRSRRRMARRSAMRWGIWSVVRRWCVAGSMASWSPGRRTGYLWRGLSSIGIVRMIRICIRMRWWRTWRRGRMGVGRRCMAERSIGTRGPRGMSIRRRCGES